MNRLVMVKFGRLSHVGRFAAEGNATYPRRSHVVLRTSRGVEIGEVLGPARDLGAQGRSMAEGSVLRRMTPEDDLVEARIQKTQQAAFEACAAKIAELPSPAALIDVELLFDGKTLLFYFLGELSPDLQGVTAELAEIYETRAEFRKFTSTVNEGCGPGCGTDDAQNGCQSCETGCALASACGSRHV